MRWVIFAASCMFLAAGCDFGFANQSNVSALQPNTPAFPSTLDDEIIHGTVTYQLLSSDCPGDTNEIFMRQHAASMIISPNSDGEDRLALHFHNMPELSGKLIDGQASIDGTMVFQTPTQEVDCVVFGDAEVGTIEVTGNLSEQLTSPMGDLNCTQNTKYTFTYEEVE